VHSKADRQGIKQAMKKTTTFWRSLQVTLVSREEPLGTAGARFMQAGCPSCHPADSVKAKKR